MKFPPELTVILNALTDAIITRGGTKDKEMREHIKIARDTYATVQYDFDFKITLIWDQEPKTEHDKEFRQHFAQVQQVYLNEIVEGLHEHFAQRDSAAAAHFDNMLLPKEVDTDASSSSH